MSANKSTVEDKDIQPEDATIQLWVIIMIAFLVASLLVLVFVLVRRVIRLKEANSKQADEAPPPPS